MKYLLFLSSLFLSVTIAAKDMPASSLCFVENKGQVKDQYGHTRKDIQYRVAGNGLSLFIGNGQLHYQWNEASKTGVPKLQALPEPTTIKSYRMDVALIGANKDAQVVTDAPLTYREHCNNLPELPGGVTAATYGKVTYRNVYPHIDWVLYIKDNKVEYDFVVHPGGRVQDIKLQHSGATQLSMEKGSIVATTPMGTIQEQIPIAYMQEDGSKVNVNYQLHKNMVTFSASPCKGTLVIDPVLQWGTYFGGTATDNCQGCCNDGAGNVYFCGYSSSIFNIATTGAFLSVWQGQADAFIAKFTPGGSIMWATYFGGANTDVAYSIVWDGSSHIYLAGGTASNTGIGTSGTYQPTFSGGDDAFLARFDTSGGFLWSTYFGSSASDYAYNVTCDHIGGIYLTGVTNSLAGIATPGSFQSTYSGTGMGDQDVFLAKFNIAGGLSWSTYYNELQGWGLACDNNNNVYIAGWGNTAGIATAGAYRTSGGVHTDFVVKFDPAGVRQWASYLGQGPVNSRGASSITSDGNGDIYITGVDSSNVIGTPGAFQPVLGTTQGNIYLAKMNTSGQMLWCTYYGGAAQTLFPTATCDSFKNILIKGAVNSATGNITANATQPVFGGGSDYFLAKFKPDGTRLWGTYYGGSGGESAGQNALTCQGGDNIYFGGYTNSTNNMTTAGCYQSAFGGNVDAFFAKFFDPSLAILQPFTDTQLCAGNAYSLHYITYRKFLAGNVFTAQLSNASGSFASPVTIGTLTADTTGVIACTLPAGTNGAGYRMRVVSSSPAIAYPDEGVNIRITSMTTPTAASNTPICSGSTLQLTAGGGNVAAAYSWAGPNSYTATGATPVIVNATTAASGTYTVTAAAYGCSSTQQTTAVVNHFYGTPAVVITTPSDTFCNTSTVVFTASAINSGSSPTYTWYKNGAAIPGINIAVYSTTAIADGDRVSCKILSNAPAICQLIDTALSNVITMHHAAHVMPPVTITMSPLVYAPGINITFTAIASGGSGNLVFQWRKNGVAINGATSSSFSSNGLLRGDIISLLVRSTLACTTPDSEVVAMNALSLPILSANTFSIYPNPAQDAITISTQMTGIATLTIYDVSGRMMTQQQVHLAGREVRVPIALVSGVYVVELTDKEGNKSLARLSVL